MLIAIDHGNKQIKTIHSTYTSGLLIGDIPPAYETKTLELGGRYCTLSERRVPYKKDKTEDDTFFILTLFGIAYEIAAQDTYCADDLMDIQLALGLPPAHFGLLRERFSNYFLNRDIITFQFQCRPYNIYIDQARVFPQAYAAVTPIIGRLKTIRKAVIVDIGGYTADYMALLSGNPDMAQCDSLNNGVIILYNEIKSSLNAVLDMALDDVQIDAVLMGQDHTLPPEAVRMIEEKATLFIDDLLGKLGERQLDLRASQPVFVGGGAVLLRRFLDRSRKIYHPIYIDDIRANVNGFQRLYELAMKVG